MVGAQDIELALKAIEAWNRVDLDGFLDPWHSDCEWRPAFPTGTEGSGTVFRGQDGVARAWRGVREAWETYLLDVTDSKVAGDDLVVLGEIHLRGKESEMELDSDWSAVVRFKDGKIIRAWDWLEHSAALEAAGLA